MTRTLDELDWPLRTDLLTLRRGRSEDAHDLDWFDQSHFIRDVRAVTGMTPSSYAQRTDDDILEP